MHWSQALTEIRARKLDLARIDPRGGMPLCPPIGASACSIANVERRIGRPLSPSYRAFLAQHDGFPQLFQSMSLLGTSPLARGTYVDLARMVLDECEAPVTQMAPASSRRRVTELIPFAIDPHAETIVAWNPAVVSPDGELEVVVWINEIGERVESFPRFLELVLDMLHADLEERSARTAHRSEPRAVASRGRSEPLVRQPPVRASVASTPRVGRPAMSSIVGFG